MTAAVIDHVWMAGFGQMGQALYHGWTTARLPLTHITLIDPAAQKTIDLRASDTLSADIPNTQTKPDILVFAIKPQMAVSLIPLYRDVIRPDTLIISIMAGVTVETICDLLGHVAQPVIRTMPNTPAMIGQGMSVSVASTHVTEQQRAVADQLWQAVGQSAWVDHEDAMHAVTALSGSGPAYVFALIETMAAAGERAGLSAELSARLARQTVIGSAALAAQKQDISPEQLRHNVTSPGGTTAVGLDVLLRAEQGLTDLMKQTIAAAAQRSRELGKAD
jgi:pyrroline-5-carboxylate reductase